MRRLLGIAGKTAGIALLGLILLTTTLIGLVAAALFEPWPISLRQGPDTGFARTAFSRTFHHANPANVHDLYVRDEWGFGGDSILTMRFVTAAQSMLDGIIKEHRLTPATADQRRSARVLDAPDWWPGEEHLHRVGELYFRAGTYLWIDRVPSGSADRDAEHAGAERTNSVQVYFQSANF